MQSVTRWLGVTCILLVGVSNCSTSTSPSPETVAAGSAADGLAAVQACDLRTASQDFENAHDFDPTRPDYALAYAVSTLAVLAEDPAVTKVLERLGFQGPIDTSIVWGSGGALDQWASQTASCQSIWTYLGNSLPYPPAHQNGPDANTAITDPTVSGNDIVTALAAISPKIQQIAAALEQAAGGMKSATLSTGCGTNTSFTVQPPELYGLAAFLDALVASIQAAQGYDWGVPLNELLTTSSESAGDLQTAADDYNAHIFRVTNKANIAAALPMAQHALAVAQLALAAAGAATSNPPNALFAWADAPSNVVDDLTTLVQGASSILSNMGLQPIPFMSPPLSLDGASFFLNPVDATTASPPIWSVETFDYGFGDTGESIVSTADGVTSQLTPRFSPYPWADDQSTQYTLMLGMRWQNVSDDTATDVFDPNGHWEKLFRCSN
jgi:hypothetical protein